VKAEANPQGVRRRRQLPEKTRETECSRPSWNVERRRAVEVEGRSEPAGKVATPKTGNEPEPNGAGANFERRSLHGLEKHNAKLGDIRGHIQKKSQASRAASAAKEVVEQRSPPLK